MGELSRLPQLSGDFRSSIPSRQINLVSTDVQITVVPSRSHKLEPLDSQKVVLSGAEGVTQPGRNEVCLSLVDARRLLDLGDDPIPTNNEELVIYLKGRR